MELIWIFILFCFLCYVVLNDKEIIKARSSKKNDENTEKLKKSRLISGRWWSWLIVIALVFLTVKSLVPSSSTTDESNKTKTHQINKKTSHKKKSINKNNQKTSNLKQTQKDLSEELGNTPTVKEYVYKIKYRGDGYADIHVTSSFTLLSNKEKSIVSQKINNFVTSYVQDTKMLDDKYAFLTFIYNGKLIGHSKQLEHNEFKWN